MEPSVGNVSGSGKPMLKKGSFLFSEAGRLIKSLSPRRLIQNATTTFDAFSTSALKTADDVFSSHPAQMIKCSTVALLQQREKGP